MCKALALMTALTLAGPCLGASVESAPLKALFHLSFDDTIAPTVMGGKVEATSVEEVKFVEGKVGKAGDFRQGGCVELRNLPRLDPKAGTIELWIKSAHDHKELEDHCYLQLFNADDTAGLEIKFYHVECSAQVTMWQGKIRARRYGWGWAKDAWRHIVVTWDAASADPTGLTLYQSGIVSGYPRDYRPIQLPTSLRVGCRSPKGGQRANALIDEVAIYNRCLTRSQVEALHKLGDLPLAEKLAKIQEVIAREDALRRKREDLLYNHRKLALVHGRYTSLKNWPDKAFTPLQLPVPDKIHETKLASTDLGHYDVLFVPGGGGLRFDDANHEALLKFVRDGGGYVGICGGAVTAARYGLIDAKRYPFGVRGKVWTFLKAHPVTDGYDVKRKIMFPHASGPLFVLEEGKSETPVATFDVGAEPLPTFTNVIAKPLGKGRVVVFSGHPEGAPETRPMLRNAVMWTARIIGE